jgi:hypothetical protein
MIDELDLLTRLGDDVAPLSADGRARVRDRILAQAGAAAGPEPIRPATSTPAPIAAPSAPPRRRWRAGRRALRLGIAGVAVGGAAVAATLALPGTANAAYDLDTGPGGAVKVQIHEFAQADKLQADLRAAGIHALVDYLPAGQACAQPRGTAVAARGQGGSAAGKVTSRLASGGAGGASLELSGPAIGPGQTLLIEASFDKNDPHKGTSLAVTVVQGAVAPCHPVAAPLPPAGTGVAGGGATTDTHGDTGGPATTDTHPGEQGAGSASEGPSLQSQGPTATGPVVDSHQG